MKVSSEKTLVTLQDTHSGILKLVEVNVASERFWELVSAANDSLSNPIDLHSLGAFTDVPVANPHDWQVKGTPWYTLKEEDATPIEDLLMRAGHGDGDIIQKYRMGIRMVHEDIDFWKFVLLIIQARHPEFEYLIVECSAFAV